MRRQSCGDSFAIPARPAISLTTAHQGEPAAAEFQKIIDHRGIVVHDPVGALARPQQARAFAVAGDRAKARDAYASFLALWKGADPDVPALQKAKAEYERLR